MKNQEEFKRLIRMAFGLSLLFVHGVLFWYMWRRYYSPLMETEYWRRGHWLMLAFYLFWSYVLPGIYGGWKVGYLKPFHIIYSQSLGMLLADLLMYVIIVLLTKHFGNPLPLCASFWQSWPGAHLQTGCI